MTVSPALNWKLGNKKDKEGVQKLRPKYVKLGTRAVICWIAATSAFLWLVVLKRFWVRQEGVPWKDMIKWVMYLVALGVRGRV